MKIVPDFPRFFRRVYLAFSNLDEDNRNIVNSLAAISIVSFLIFLSTELFFPDNTFSRIVSGIALAVVIPTSFAAGERINILMPIENQVKTLIKDAQNNIKEFASLIDDEQKLIETNLKGIVDKLDRYSDYNVARSNFGFSKMVGIRLERDQHTGELLPRRASLILEMLSSARSGAELHYMTSFVGEVSDYVIAITQAVQRGVNVKVLLMMPSVRVPVVKARFTDAFQETSAQTSEEKSQSKLRLSEFVTEIRLKASSLLRLRDVLQENYRRSEGRSGLEIRFYTLSLNFPMIYLKQKSTNGLNEEFVYTGFYTTNNAEEMPYIEWNGGSFDISKRFINLFNKKWESCRENVELIS